MPESTRESLENDAAWAWATAASCGIGDEAHRTPFDPVHT